MKRSSPVRLLMLLSHALFLIDTVWDLEKMEFLRNEANKPPVINKKRIIEIFEKIGGRRKFSCPPASFPESTIVRREPRRSPLDPLPLSSNVCYSGPNQRTPTPVNGDILARDLPDRQREPK